MITGWPLRKIWGRCLPKFKKENVEKYILDDTNGRGVDLAIEAAGSYVALNSSMEVIKRWRNINLWSVWRRPSPC